jgi:uncharacterized protein YigE (DUF2233 family)
MTKETRSPKHETARRFRAFDPSSFVLRHCFVIRKFVIRHFVKNITSIACILTLPIASHGEETKRVEFEGKSFTVVRVSLDKQHLQLFLNNDAGVPFKSFDAIQASIAKNQRWLVFAMNAGMYHANFSPVGLYVENGKQLFPLNLANDQGNFFMKPNGVFAITDSGARVVESSTYPTLGGKVALATQSGPMLVIDGKIHPVFRPDSNSRLVRNGVGVVSPKSVVFAISEEPVNFYEFAVFFRDCLHCKNALFLDGTVSSIYSEALKRNDKRIDLGPMIGITAEE